MLLVDVHELDIILADPVHIFALEGQVDDIGGILRLQRQDVFRLARAEDLGQGSEIDAEGDVAVAAVRAESVSAQQHGHEGNVGVVHGLQGETRVIAVEVAVLDEILDSIDDLKGNV